MANNPRAFKEISSSRELVDSGSSSEESNGGKMWTQTKRPNDTIKGMTEVRSD